MERQLDAPRRDRRAAGRFLGDGSPSRPRLVLGTVGDDEVTLGRGAAVHVGAGLPQAPAERAFKAPAQHPAFEHHPLRVFPVPLARP